jgi:hypothetical protein
MYRVSDEQIEFILDDIKKRGVEIESLQLNLLDHICCIIEREYHETDDFNTIYETTIKQFFKTELWEIEEETIGLLHFKHYYKMKRFLYILFVLSLSFNVYVLSKMGYEYYKLKKWQSHFELMQKANYSDGFTDFKNKLRADHPEILKKQYIYITISTSFWDYGPESATMVIDSFTIKEDERRRIKNLKLRDSLASIYTKNISFVHVYPNENKKINEEIEKNKKNTKNIIYIKEVSAFGHGYIHKKQKEGMLIPTNIVIDTSGKIIYQQSLTAKQLDKKLISILNNIK